ncbi:hypothetical protein SPRG_19858 [Saprolegnia parasitica CBS 223.65]|uniref:EF-hand domain-containing protein n=1 Tax=Saprolegnia parasitica (strain CBS 223.65) TaxID=695850 RepID=A0A067CH14_SAPPC|nr:hypothetical protein SPRG_19858 [Saprolegnia parasitica CBS 223.65]KDO30039.1 hypothetical protein SPRG_19858 [Saprolegnia parasitica CBS 223.65]|eukprot:XP_012199366.1 hypothetical protein SPRG_19858 [Saprolegnia parasitica CBS 223.65]
MLQPHLRTLRPKLRLTLRPKLRLTLRPPLPRMRRPMPPRTLPRMPQQTPQQRNGLLDLSEVEGYVNSLKQKAIADINTGAAAATASITESYSAKIKCIQDAFSQLYGSSPGIPNDSALQAFFQVVDVNCGTLVTPTPTTSLPLPVQLHYTHSDVIDYVSNTLQGSKQFINCTSSALSKYPANQPLSYDDVQVLLYTVRHVCLPPTTPVVTTVTPEPTTVTPEPTTVTPEPTTVTPEPTTVTPEPTTTWANVTTIWFNSPDARAIVLTYLVEYFATLDKCIDVGVDVFGINGVVQPNKIPSLLSWIRDLCMLPYPFPLPADLNRDGYVSELEIATGLVQQRNTELATVNNDPAKFFAIRATFDAILQCASSAFEIFASTTTHLLNPAEFLGFETYTNSTCTKPVIDTDVSGPDRVATRDIALALNTSALQSLAIEDHYLLLQSCYDDAWSTVGPSPYSGLLQNVTWCMTNAKANTPSDLLVLPKPDFHSLLNASYVGEYASLHAQIASLHQQELALIAKENALIACVSEATETVADGKNRVPQRYLPRAETLVNTCYANAS